MHKPGRPVVFDDAKQQIFLRLTAAGFSAVAAARHIGVSLSAVRYRARQNPGFDAAYRQAKAEAIPSLLETIRGAGQRSWRASAWLLERLRPAEFGRRVALGPDSSIPPPAKTLSDFSADEMVKHFMSSIRFSREAQQLARNYLGQVEAELDAWDAAEKAHDEEYKKRGGRPHVFDPPEDEDPGPGATDASPPSNLAAEPIHDLASTTQSSNVNNSPNCRQPPDAQPQPVQHETTTDHLAEPPNNCSFNP
jgi:hypothetical protein